MTDKVKKYCDGLDCDICDEKEPCIYKIANELEEKLQAKEKECERLREEKAEILEKTGMIETLQGYTVKNIEYMQQQLDQLKAENEKLKQYKGSKQASYETMQREWNEAKNEVKELKAENEELKRQIKVKGNILKLTNEAKNEYLDENNKLKQALKEIKEIAEDAKTKVFVDMEEFWKQILQIINEVEDGI